MSVYPPPKEDGMELNPYLCDEGVGFPGQYLLSDGYRYLSLGTGAPQLTIPKRCISSTALV